MTISSNNAEQAALQRDASLLAAIVVFGIFAYGGAYATRHVHQEKSATAERARKAVAQRALDEAFQRIDERPEDPAGLIALRTASRQAISSSPDMAALLASMALCLAGTMLSFALSYGAYRFNVLSPTPSAFMGLIPIVASHGSFVDGLQLENAFAKTSMIWVEEWKSSQRSERARVMSDKGSLLFLCA